MRCGVGNDEKQRLRRQRKDQTRKPVSAYATEKNAQLDQLD